MGQSKILVRCFSSIPKFRPLKIHNFENTSNHTTAPSPSYFEAETKVINLLNRRPIPPPFVFNLILLSVVKNKDFNSTLKIGQKFLLHRRLFDSHTLHIFMNCCCSVNQVQNAYSLVSLLIKCGFELGTIIFNTLLKGLVLEGRVFEAFQLSELMRNQGIFMSEVSYAILIRGLCDSNQVGSVLFLLNRIIKNEFPDIYPNVVIFGTVIASLFKYERYEMAFH